MDWLPIVFGLGSASLFASRAFLTAFVTALLLRFQPDLPFGASWFLPAPRGDEASWFTSDAALWVLGALAFLEVAAEKSSDARTILQQVDRYLKPAMAALTFLGVSGAAAIPADTEALKQGGVIDSLSTTMVVILTWWLAGARADALTVVDEADADGAVGIAKLFSYVEDLWSIFGVLWLLIYPIVMAALLGVASAMLLWIRARAIAREERNRIACDSCAAMMHRSAPYCPRCGHAAAAPRALAWLGTSSEEPADRAALPYQLLECGRCPRCAERIERNLERSCGTCGRLPFHAETTPAAYAKRVTSRLPSVLIATGLLSLIPVIGLIPGVLVYRVRLVAPFSRYLPLGRRVLGRMAIRVLFLVLVVLQVVPLVGAAAVPVMALVNFAYYRRAFLSEVGSPD